VKEFLATFSRGVPIVSLDVTVNTRLLPVDYTSALIDLQAKFVSSRPRLFKDLAGIYCQTQHVEY
jgi:hypothetical protein